MKRPEDLLLLIRSLTPAEKRYFKLHAKAHVTDKYKNHYEKLFDALNYWEADYDEAAFKRKHRAKAFTKNLPEHKQYLYDVIVDACLQQNLSSSVELQFYKGYERTTFFSQKRMMHPFEDEYEKLEAIANNQHNLEKKLFLAGKKRGALQNTLKDEDFERYEQEIAALLEQYGAYNKLVTLIFKLRTYTEQTTTKPEEIEQLYEKARAIYDQNPSFDSVQQLWQLMAQITTIYFYCKNDLEQAYRHIRQSLERMEAFGTPHFDTPIYISSIANALQFVAPTHQRFIEEAPALVVKLKQLDFQNVLPRAVGGGYKLYLLAAYELKYYQLLKQYERCDDVFLNFQSEYQKQYKQLLTVRDYCIVLFAYILIQVEKVDYAKGLEYTEQMLSVIKKVHYSYEIAARTTQFFLLIKLQQYDKAENVYRSLKKFVSEQTEEDKFLTALLQLCKAIVKTASLHSAEVTSANEILQNTDSHVEIFHTNIKKELVETLLHQS